MPESFLIEGDELVRVVGTSHYQEALRALAGGGDVRHGATATLVPEPENPHDPGAIAVEIDGQRVGYLSRDENPRWREVVEKLAAHDHRAAAEAFVSGRADTYLGVFLRLPTPTEARAQVGIRFGR